MRRIALSPRRCGYKRPRLRFYGVVPNIQQGPKVNERRQVSDFRPAHEPGAVADAMKDSTFGDRLRMAVGVHRRERLNNFPEIHIFPIIRRYPKTASAMTRNNQCD